MNTEENGNVLIGFGKEATECADDLIASLDNPQERPAARARLIRIFTHHLDINFMLNGSVERSLEE